MVLKTKRLDDKHAIALISIVQDSPQIGDLEIAVCKRVNGGGLEPIPDDEPVILFRGRDNLALAVLLGYQRLCEADGCTLEHMETLKGMIQKFQYFRQQNESRMKQPGITRGR